MSSFAERLTGGFPFAIEITPPKTPTPEVLLRRASLVKGTIGTVDIVQRTDRQNSLEAAAQLANAGFDPIWHLVINGTSTEEIDTILTQAADLGLNSVLMIKGNGSQKHNVTVKDTVSIAAREHSGMLIGVAFNQFVQPIESQIKTTAAKVQSGAGYIQTQPIINLDAERPTFKALEQASGDARIVAMCMPLTSVEIAQSMSQTLKLPIDKTILEQLKRNGPEFGWKHFRNTLTGIARSGLFAGIIIMTYENDPLPEFGARIAESLELI